MSTLQLDHDRIPGTLTAEDLKLAGLHAELETRFDRIRFIHPRLKDCHIAFETIRIAARMARADADRRGPDLEGREPVRPPQLMLPVIGPSGSGKSISARSYVADVVMRERPARGTMPALYVELRPNSNTKKMLSDFLRASGDELPDDGTEADLLRRCKGRAKKIEADIVFWDEVHNLIPSDDGTMRLSVLYLIKHLVNVGRFAVVILGVERSFPPLFASKEIISRTRPPFLLNPLSISDLGELNYIQVYIGRLDQAMVELGVTEGPSGLLYGDIPACYYETTTHTWDGRRGVIIGDISKLTRAALGVMAARVLAGPNEPRVITRSDLALAVDRWAIPLKLCKRNAFRNGASKFQTR